MSHGKPVNPIYRPYLDGAVAELLKGNPYIRESTVESYEARLVSVINRLEGLRLPVDPA